MTISLCERLESRRQSKPNKLAYIIDGVERSNEASIDHVFRIANGLIAAGIGKGDRVAVLSRNSVECAEVNDRYFVLGRKYGSRTQHRNARSAAEYAAR